MSYNEKCRWFSMEYVGNPGAVPACNQKGTLELFDCATCPENPDNKKTTNADRIRNMSDEELAELLHNAGGNWYSETYWLDWLKEEVE